MYICAISDNNNTAVILKAKGSSIAGRPNPKLLQTKIR
jgi:hypothetical protein